MCVCVCVLVVCCIAAPNNRYPAASVPDGRLHSEAVLRGVAVLGARSPVDGEGSRERQPGQPGPRDEPQHQLPAGPQEQAVVPAAGLLLHPVWSIWRRLAVAGRARVRLRSRCSGVAVQHAAAGQGYRMQPTARCQDHQLSSRSRSDSEVDAATTGITVVDRVVPRFNGPV